MPAADSVVSLGSYTEEAADGVWFFFNVDVTSSDRQRISAGISAAQSYLAVDAGSVVEPVCVDVRVTESALAGSARVTGSHVVIFTSAAGWPDSRAWHLQLVAAHEFVHTWQYLVSGNTPPGGPTWLVEGAAQLIAVKSLIKAEVLSSAEAESLVVRPTGALVPLLRMMEEPSGFDVVNSSYGLACAAVDLLTAGPGLGALERFWSEVGPGKAWQEAFTAAFHLTPEEFYEHFEYSDVRGFGIRVH